jgi:hypothetical protein
MILRAPISPIVLSKFCMNCRDFENIVYDLSRGNLRGSLMDAAAREAGLNHARDCAVCAARLANEQSLTAGLQALAAGDEGKIASAALETDLLAAFRKEQRSAAQPVGWSRWSRWALAAAAVILIALGLITFRAMQPRPAKPDLTREKQPLITTPTPAPEMQIPGSQVEPRVTRDQLAVTQKKRHSIMRAGDKRRQRPPVNQTGALPDGQLLIRDGMTLYGNESEITTDFLLLSSGRNLTALDRGQVIRLEVPRSTLVSFGLPMNAERSDVPVKADLLVGEDGLARAIRFIR